MGETGRAVLGALALILMGVAGAGASDIRPEPRPALAGAAPKTVLRPIPRPEPRPVPLAVTRAAPAFGGGLGLSLVPRARPDDLAAPRGKGLFTPAAQLRPSRKGSVCGDRSIRGVTLDPIAGRIAGCGVAAPVRVSAVDGVTLSQPSVMDCDTAQALKDWINDGVRPAVGRSGGGLAGLRVAAHYVCRTRNHKPGAKISEHGKGRAIDISGLILADGTELSVLRDWGQRRSGRILRAAHGAACGPFGTVLGPEADRYHRDHFHFDTARYRSGSYCR